MTELPICPLCKTRTGSLDKWGLCQRISPTHEAIRHPDRYPADQHKKLWALILSGKPVFPTSKDTRP